MHRIDTATRAIDLFGAGKDGLKDGNKALGISATDLTAAWFNDVQENLAQVLEDAGLALVKGDYAQLKTAIKTIFQKAAAMSAAASGTVDAITANFTPAITALSDHLLLIVRAGGANTSTTPTFTPASATIAAKTIVKGHNQPLAPGDISGAGFRMELQYDLTLDKWVLLNPANGVIKTAMGVYSGVAQYNVATTLTAADIGKVIAVGGAGGPMTLPLLSATRPGDSIVLFCQGGTASVQPQGTDTLYGASSMLASLTFKGNEYVEVTNFGSSWVISSGSWLASAVGVNQTWQNVAGSRAIGTTYTNTTGRPIVVKVSYGLVSGNGLKLTVGGVDVAFMSGNSATVIYQTIEAEVPSGATYVLSYFVGSSSTAQSWAELR